MKITEEVSEAIVAHFGTGRTIQLSNNNLNHHADPKRLWWKPRKNHGNANPQNLR